VLSDLFQDNCHNSLTVSHHLGSTSQTDTHVTEHIPRTFR